MPEHRLSTADQAAAPTFRDALGVWGTIGLLSFGGPAGQIALMHRLLVDERRWIGEAQFLAALNFCMLLPGPEAMQLATYVGWRLHGVAGGLAAGLLFVLPGAALMLVLSLSYALFGQVPVVAALFLGIKAAVLAIVVEALLRVARRALKGRFEWVIAGIAFLAIFCFAVPFPVIVIAAGLIGYWRGRRQPADAAQADSLPLVPLSRTAATLAIWLAIWALPLLAVVAVFGRAHVLSEMAVFFSKLAVVTFGGAYAVLAYMAQAVVSGYHWMEPGEMLDALGLAETTPGPLILVTEFVGVVAGFRHGGGSPVMMGVLGGLVTLWATFAPCFLWIFVGAPYVEWLNREPRLKAALALVTAAVVGVILNLSLWFALHVLFGEFRPVDYGPLHVMWPELASLRVLPAALSALSAFALFGLHWGVIRVLALAAGASLVAHFAGLG